MKRYLVLRPGDYEKKEYHHESDHLSHAQSHHHGSSHGEHVAPMVHEVKGRYARDFESINAILNKPPESWAAYEMDAKGLHKIIEMEFSELSAFSAMGDYRGTVENLKHVAAACIMAHHKMTCKEYD